MKKSTGVILQYLFFFGLGIFLVWWSIKDIDGDSWLQIKNALSNAKLYLIVPVFIVLFSSHYVRALRWRLLIESLDYRPSKTNTFFSVLIGYLTNMAVPRLGEIMKCTMLSRFEKIPAEKLIGTIILERIIDAICLLIVFVITLIIQPGLYNRLATEVFSISSGGEKDKAIPSYLLTLIVIVVVAIIISIWMAVKKKTIADVKTLLQNILQRVWQGLNAVQHLKKRSQFIALTVLLWSLYLCGGYIGFYAFQETEQYGVKEAFTILSAGSIGMIVTPGGIGAYAYLIESTMQLYGLNSTIAIAFGWILWIAQTIVILIGGLLSLVLLPIYNKKKLSGPTTLNTIKT